MRCFVVTGPIVLIATALFGAEGPQRTWNFDSEPRGRIAKGFTNEVGLWIVVEAEQGKVLTQTAKNPDATFNITLITDTSAKDVEISVEIKAIAGELDQGGGVVWRAKDASNYYLARHNPLEDNYRFFRLRTIALPVSGRPALG